MEHLYVVFRAQSAAARDVLQSELLRDIFEVCCWQRNTQGADSLLCPRRVATNWLLLRHRCRRPFLSLFLHTLSPRLNEPLSLSPNSKWQTTLKLRPSLR